MPRPSNFTSEKETWYPMQFHTYIFLKIEDCDGVNLICAQLSDIQVNTIIS